MNDKEAEEVNYLINRFLFNNPDTLGEAVFHSRYDPGSEPEFVLLLCKQVVLLTEELSRINGFPNELKGSDFDAIEKRSQINIKN